MNRTLAPGKLLLSGAYAVLEGAPAIVCAINRYAYAFDGAGSPTTEIQAALERPCAVDTHELEDDGHKLGLGSSAAALVAAVALRAAESGQDVTDPSVRKAIFERAREVHARVQKGGSGVDVAASTFGGALRYTTKDFGPVELPSGLELATFFSGGSARTSTLRERVAALASRDPSVYAARMSTLVAIANAASNAVGAGDASLFVSAVSDSLEALEALGAAADAPIVPPAFAALGRAARGEGAAFIPSGAGGGDVGVFVGTKGPSASFMEAARASMKHLSLELDSRGVRLEAQGR